MLDAGNFKLRHGVLEIMAGVAISQVEGASGIGVRSDHPEDLKKRKSLAKGIKTELSEGRVSIEVDVNIDYGKDFLETGRRIQAEIKGAVEGMTGWSVENVDVNVVGVNAL